MFEFVGNKFKNQNYELFKLYPSFSKELHIINFATAVTYEHLWISAEKGRGQIIC